MDLGKLPTAVARASGLAPEDAETVKELVALWSRKRDRNLLRDRYYLGHVPIKDLGIAIPPRVARKLNTRVDWPRKAVLALANRSVFDGFTAADDDVKAALAEVVDANDMRSLYRRNLVGELKHCCGFWTVTEGEGVPVVSAYPATAACALWDDGLKEIRAGLVVVESRARAATDERTPTCVEVYTADAVISIRRTWLYRWEAYYLPHSMGRPLMEPMPYEPTLEQPFGHSRITRTVMSLTDDAIRQRARMEVAAESAALPQMWLLGTAMRMINDGNKYDASMGSINEITKDKDGDSPTIWQSTQLSMQPHTEYLRTLASQFSSATNVPLAELGVTTDNPSSAEAIYAAKEPLVVDAQNLNKGNEVALRNVALMCLAFMRDTDFAAQRDAGHSISVHWPDPAYPSVGSMADAVVKIATAIPAIAESEVILERLTFSAEEIERINSDRKEAQANAAVMSLLAPKKDGESAAPDQKASEDAAEVGGKALNGAQTQSLIAIMGQYSSGAISEGQAVNLVSASIGISKDAARAILNGDM